MTTVGAIRAAYDQAHRESDPRPSRFRDPVIYFEWCERAARWAEHFMARD